MFCGKHKANKRHCTHVSIKWFVCVCVGCAIVARWWPMFEFVETSFEFYTQSLFLGAHNWLLSILHASVAVPTVFQPASQPLYIVYNMPHRWLKCYVNKSDWNSIGKQTNKQTTCWTCNVNRTEGDSGGGCCDVAKASHLPQHYFWEANIYSTTVFPQTHARTHALETRIHLFLCSCRWWPANTIHNVPIETHFNSFIFAFISRFYVQSVVLCFKWCANVDTDSATLSVIDALFPWKLFSLWLIFAGSQIRLKFPPRGSRKRNYLAVKGDQIGKQTRHIQYLSWPSGDACRWAKMEKL